MTGSLAFFSKFVWDLGFLACLSVKYVNGSNEGLGCRKEYYSTDKERLSPSHHNCSASALQMYCTYIRSTPYF